MLNFIAYVLIFIVSIIIFIIEKRDWECTNPYGLWNCNKGDGMSYRGSKPENTDSCFELLNKILIASQVEVKSIKWRRSFLLSVISVLLSFSLIITPGSLPKWYTFLSSVLIISLVLYFNFNNYSYHKYQKPINYIEKSINTIKYKIANRECLLANKPGN